MVSACAIKILRLLVSIRKKMDQLVAALSQAELLFRRAALAKVIFGYFTISRPHRREPIAVASGGALYIRQTTSFRARPTSTTQVEDLGNGERPEHDPDDGSEDRKALVLSPPHHHLVDQPP
jgi:hypothetical protein